MISSLTRTARHKACMASHLPTPWVLSLATFAPGSILLIPDCGDFVRGQSKEYVQHQLELNGENGCGIS